jgi:uridine kinase
MKNVKRDLKKANIDIIERNLAKESVLNDLKKEVEQKQKLYLEKKAQFEELFAKQRKEAEVKENYCIDLEILFSSSSTRTEETHKRV